MSGLTLDGTAEPASRDQIFRYERGSGKIPNGDREKNIFPVQLTTSRIGSLTRLIFTPATVFVLLFCFSSHSFWTSKDVPAGATQEEGNTGFSIHLLSAVLALIFLARRIQPFLSLVDRKVESCVLTI